MTNNFIIKTIGKFNNNIFRNSTVVKNYHQATFIAEQIIGKFIIADCKANAIVQTNNQMLDYTLNNENEGEFMKIVKLEEKITKDENENEKVLTYIIVTSNNNITIDIIPIEQIDSLDEFSCYEDYLINRPIE